MKDKIERISEACELCGLSLVLEHPYEEWSVYRHGYNVRLAHFCLDEVGCDQIDSFGYRVGNAGIRLSTLRWK